VGAGLSALRCPDLRLAPEAATCRSIRKDPVQFRVAIPAADPPDNNTHRS